MYCHLNLFCKQSVDTSVFLFTKQDISSLSEMSEYGKIHPEILKGKIPHYK